MPSALLRGHAGGGRRPIFILLLLMAVLGASVAARSEPDVAALAERLDQDWAAIFYDVRESGKVKRLTHLLARAEALNTAHRGRAEPRIIVAVTLCSLAVVDWGLDSLRRIERARQLLLEAVDLDPKALEGAAYIALGNLYWRLPGWPISFGDDARARQYLTNAVRLYPAAIDSNFFMADFLIDQGEYQRARPFLAKAEQAPIRPNARLSDTKLKEEIAAAKRSLDEQSRARPGFFSRLLPDFAAP